MLIKATIHDIFMFLQLILNHFIIIVFVNVMVNKSTQIFQPKSTQLARATKIKTKIWIAQ